MPGLAPYDQEDDVRTQRSRGGIVPWDDQSEDQGKPQPVRLQYPGDESQPFTGIAPAADKQQDSEPGLASFDEHDLHPRLATKIADESDSAGLAPATEEAPPELGLAPFNESSDAALKSALAIPPPSATTIGQERLTAASQNAQGPRPTDPNAVPGAHHGWRKTGDVAAAIGMGALTMNPMAGLGTYKLLNEAPLRKAQSGYDAQDATFNRNMSNLKTIESAEQGEQRINALSGRVAGLTAERDARTNKLNSTFVAGSEREDPNSPTGWVAETAGGETKPFTPKGSQKQTDAEKHAAIMAQRNQDVKELGLTGDEAKYYRANGKLREPGQQTNIHLPNAEASEYQDWKAAYKAEHGKDPDAKAIEGYKRGVKADTSKPPYMRSPEAFRDHYENAQHGEYAVLQKQYDAARAKAVKANINDQKAMAEAVAEVNTDFAMRKSKIDEKKAADGEAFGVNFAPSDYSYLNPAAQPPSQPAPAPVAQSPIPGPTAQDQVPIVTPTTKQKVQIGQPVMVGGQPMYVTGFNPQTGKPKVSANKPHQPAGQTPAPIQQVKDSKGNTYKVGDEVMHGGVRKRITAIQNGRPVVVPVGQYQ